MNQEQILELILLAGSLTKLIVELKRQGQMESEALLRLAEEKGPATRERVDAFLRQLEAPVEG